MSNFNSNIKIYSREKLEMLIETGLPKNVAIISFYDPSSDRTPKEYKHIDFSGCNNHVFLVGIHDIDIEILNEYGLTYDTYFPEVNELSRFIYDSIDNGLDIICQCEYGQSRSAGCAAAILEHFAKNGISIFADYHYYPNQMIFNKTLEALKSYEDRKTKD